MLAASPVSEYVVAVEPVLDTRTDQVVPLSVDLSILYPVIAEPPLFDGANQDRLICDDEIAIAASPVGGCGAVAMVPEPVSRSATSVPKYGGTESYGLSNTSLVRSIYPT